MKNEYMFKLTELLEERDKIELELCDMLQDIQELKTNMEIKENILNSTQKEIEEMLKYLKTESPFLNMQEMKQEQEQDFDYRSRIKACRDV